MEHIASISYGKDSLAMLEVIHRHSLPLDRIVHVEIMATDTIHADLQPMVAFKEKADKIIYEKYGIQVEHMLSVFLNRPALTSIPFTREWSAKFSSRKQSKRSLTFR